MKTLEQKHALAEKWKAHNAAKKRLQVQMAKPLVFKSAHGWVVKTITSKHWADGIIRNYGNDEPMTWSEAVAVALANISVPVTDADYTQAA